MELEVIVTQIIKDTKMFFKLFFITSYFSYFWHTIFTSVLH